MGRSGKKTVVGTSVDEIVIKIIDAYIEQEKKKRILTPEKSRAQIIQDAILNLIQSQGVLDKVLQSVGCSSEEVENIRARLKLEYGVSPKS